MSSIIENCLLEAVIRLKVTDSSNNYAMLLLDADKARAGTTVVAEMQTWGKGQRGHSWKDEPGKSLLMSVVTAPAYSLQEQFLFSAAVAVAIAGVVRSFDPAMSVHVKWPNDIIINDRKAGGILIENVLRGSSWPYAIVGFGLNVLQENIPGSLPHATSLALNSARKANPEQLMQELREAILSAAMLKEDEETILESYNRLLYRRDQEQEFERGDDDIIKGVITGVNPEGLLVLRSAGGFWQLKHGDARWRWPMG